MTNDRGRVRLDGKSRRGNSRLVPCYFVWPDCLSCAGMPFIALHGREPSTTCSYWQREPGSEGRPVRAVAYTCVMAGCLGLGGCSLFGKKPQATPAQPNPPLAGNGLLTPPSGPSVAPTEQ